MPRVLAVLRLGVALPLPAGENAPFNPLRACPYRDKLEHVKPETWTVPLAGLDRMCASAGTAFAHLLESFSRHLQAEELKQVEAALSKFAAHKS
jgi:hypothetical protein